MEAMSCEIIRDLLPSYADGICSEESRRCVEEHIRTCAECKGRLDRMKKTAIVADGLEKKEFQAAKKIKRQNGMMNGAFLLLAILFGVFIMRYDWGTMTIGTWQIRVNFLPMPILMAGLYLFTFSQEKKKTVKKSDVCLGMISIAMSIYSFGILSYSTACIQKGEAVFGIRAEGLGSFIGWQYFVITVIQFLLLAWILFRDIRQGTAEILLPNLCFTGMYVTLSLRSYLAMLDEIYIAVSCNTVFVLVTGAAATLIFLIFDRIRRGRA